MADYKFSDSRLIDIKKTIVNNIEKEMKCKQLADVETTNGSEKYRFPVVNSEVSVSVVDEQGVIPVSDLGLKHVDIPLKKYSVIVPFTKEAEAFDEFNVKEEILKACSRAISTKVDADFITLMETNAKEVTSTSTTSANNLDKDLSSAFGEVEALGYDVTNVVLPTGQKGKVRALMQNNSDNLVTINEVYGVQTQYHKTLGDKIEGLVLDNSQMKLILSNNLDVEVLSEGTYTVGSGSSATSINLGQQYMLALRVVCFIGMGKFNNASAIIKVASGS